MKIELMRQERMGVEGKGILRSLQNDRLPLIDLLIREALQNSLDATKSGSTETYVDVGICSFNSDLLADQLQGITDKLKKRYSNKVTKAICISDKNTSGLVGDARKKEGNIYNLIYTIQKNQEQAGAGGSWGLGKTSYFRIGNGIVLYYSRVEISKGKYEERLAASLIEDSTKSNRILDNDRGIAWWGEKDEHDYDDFDPTYPLTNCEHINKILSIFNIKPYVNEETGTTIIIPFINEDKLLPKHENEGRIPYWWETNLKDAIEIAIQKWYAPRIFNSHYEGAYLVPSINHKLLTPSDFQPFFKKIHELYLCGLKKEGVSNINVDTIELKSRGISSDNGVVGWLSHGLYSKKNLNMTPPNNDVHPLEYFGYSNLEEFEKTNSKIVAYARKPGMILEYDIDGEWSKTMSPSDDEFLLAFFLPNSKGKLYDKFVEPNVVETLEDYLRKTEKSDHAEWEDVTLNNTKITIVNRIKRNVSKAMQEKYNESKDNTSQSRASVLGRKIGDLLLPKHAVTGKGAIPPIKPAKKDDGGYKGRKRSVSIEVLDVGVNKVEDLVVTFKLNIEKNVISDVSVNLRTGNKNYTEKDWKKDMGVDATYPFLIKEIFVTKIGNDEVDLNSESTDDKRLSMLLTTFGNTSSVTIQNNLEEDNLEIEGKLLIEVYDVLMQPLLVASEVKENV